MQYWYKLPLQEIVEYFSFNAHSARCGVNKGYAEVVIFDTLLLIYP